MDGAPNTAICGTGLMGASSSAVNVGGGRHTMEELFLACKQVAFCWCKLLRCSISYYCAGRSTMAYHPQGS